MNNEVDYKKIFSEIIKKQIDILGPDITFAKVKKVSGINIDSQGNVISITGDPKNLLTSLINEFVELSGLIIRKTIESVFSTYPAIADLSALNLNNSINGMIEAKDEMNLSGA